MTDSVRTTDSFASTPDHEAEPVHMPQMAKTAPSALMTPVKVALEDDKEATIQRTPRMIAPERGIAPVVFTWDSMYFLRPEVLQRIKNQLTSADHTVRLLNIEQMLPTCIHVRDMAL